MIAKDWKQSELPPTEEMVPSPSQPHNRQLQGEAGLRTERRREDSCTAVRMALCLLSKEGGIQKCVYVGAYCVLKKNSKMLTKRGK